MDKEIWYTGRKKGGGMKTSVELISFSVVRVRAGDKAEKSERRRYDRKAS